MSNMSNLPEYYGIGCDEKFATHPYERMLKKAHDVISKMEMKDGWNALRRYNDPEDGFMFGNHPPQITKIRDAVSSNDHSHSGASLGYTMGEMEYIAKNGYEKWMEKEE